MTLRKLILSSLLLAVLSGSYAAFAQGNMLRGKVRNTAGRAMPQVLVELQSGNGQMIHQVVTNNEGDFFFPTLTDTTYIVVISLPDYQPVNERVEFVKHTSPEQPGETRYVELTLAAKGGGAPVKSSRPVFAQNVPQAARDAFDRAIKLSRESQSKPSATPMQAVTSLQAVAALQEAIKLFPDYFDAHFALANEWMKDGKLNDAIAELEKARQINPRDDRVYQVFGMALSQQKKFMVAAAVFGEAARLNPTDPQILLLRATALIDHASTLDPSKPDREQSFAEAQKSLAKAFEMSGRKLSTTHLQMARIYEKKGERAKAADELEQYLRETPDAKNAAAIREGARKLRSAK